MELPFATKMRFAAVWVVESLVANAKSDSLVMVSNAEVIEIWMAGLTLS